MDITTNKINGANAEVSATVAKSDLDAQMDTLAIQLSKQANIPGFRKGKVPLSAVKRQYGERLAQDAESELVRRALDKGLDEMEVNPDMLVGEPQFSAFDKQDDGSITFTIKVAMRPQIDLGDYKSKIPDFAKPNVTDKAVTDRIQEVAQAQAAFVDVEEDRALQEGDTAVIDFEGFLDGEPFEGGKAEGFSLAIGSGQFIPGFEEALLGMSKGEERTIDVTFPEEYGNEALAGKPTQFKVKLHQIQVKEQVRMDAKLAKQLLPGDEEATIDKVKEQVQKQLENEAVMKLYAEELKPKLLETFVAEYEFDLPEFVVEQEMDMTLNNKARAMSEQDLEAIKSDQEQLIALRETLREDATRSVKATFLIDALAKAEGVGVDEQEVMQTIYFEAMQSGQDPQTVYKQYEESGYLPAVQMAMVENKVLSSLLDAKLKTEEETTS